MSKGKKSKSVDPGRVSYKDLLFRQVKAERAIEALGLDLTAFKKNVREAISTLYENQILLGRKVDTLDESLTVIIRLLQDKNIIESTEEIAELSKEMRQVVAASNLILLLTAPVAKKGEGVESPPPPSTPPQEAGAQPYPKGARIYKS